MLKYQKKLKDEKIIYLHLKGSSDRGPKEAGEIHSGEKLAVKHIFCAGLPGDYEEFQFVCGCVTAFREIS